MGTAATHLARALESYGVDAVLLVLPTSLSETPVEMERGTGIRRVVTHGEKVRPTWPMGARARAAGSESAWHRTSARPTSPLACARRGSARPQRWRSPVGPTSTAAADTSTRRSRTVPSSSQSPSRAARCTAPTGSLTCSRTPYHHGSRLAARHPSRRTRVGLRRGSQRRAPVPARCGHGHGCHRPEEFGHPRRGAARAAMKRHRALGDTGAGSLGAAPPRSLSAPRQRHHEGVRAHV